jgi:two-component system, OmpR family, KDP operon response regulator KdpE
VSEAVVPYGPAEHGGPAERSGLEGAAAPAAAGAPGRPQRVLIVEDEPALLRALRINLRARGYEVITAGDGRTALAGAARRPPDAVLLDLGLPDVDGVTVIHELRAWSRAPVIVLSGRSGSGDKIGALDAGANDYVTKPFDIEELLARLRAVLRRDPPAGPATIRLGRWTIDLVAYTAVGDAAGASDGPSGSSAGEPEIAHLTPTEWRLLEILLRRWCPPGCYSPACGGQGTSGARTTCASTWPGCGASWKTTRRGPATC